MADVQMDLNDILERFGNETSNLSRRAVLAEAKAEAYEKACEEKDAVIGELARRMAEAGVPLPGEEAPEPANRAEKRAAARKPRAKKAAEPALKPVPDSK